VFEVVDYALKRGAKYVDVRVQLEESTGFTASEGVVDEGGTVSLRGVGVRVIVDGAWGFSSVDNASSEAKMRETVDRAIKLAGKSAQGIFSPVELAPTEVYHVRAVDESSELEICKEFAIEDVLEPAKECDRRIRSAGTEIQASSLSFTIGRFIETFASSDGSLITQAFTGYLGTLYVIASNEGISEYYPHDFGGLGDYRTFLNQDLPAISERIAAKTCQLVRSRTLNQIPSFETVIMDPEFVALWVHETIGHPLEADRVLGGRGDPQNAPWTCNALGNKVADECFSVVDDPSIKNPACFDFDSEGVRGRRKPLITKGVMKNCIHNRETAAAFHVEPNGGARSPSYRFTPMPRMSNTYVEPGDWTLEETIEDTKEGIYVVGSIAPSVDGRAYGWKISAKESYIVAKGEIGEMLRGVIVSEVTPDFLISIDALTKDLRITVTPDCGKGSPIQMLPVGNGGPTIRGKAYVAGVE